MSHKIFKVLRRAKMDRDWILYEEMLRKFGYLILKFIRKFDSPFYFIEVSIY